jgi:hypothetical protein
LKEIRISDEVIEEEMKGKSNRKKSKSEFCLMVDAMLLTPFE